jgi:3-oxo-5-alpha-steroid 4-dehydrogenase 3
MYAKGLILQTILQLTPEPETPTSAMQVSIGWFALFLLSMRRLLECREAASSSSRMFFGHWIMGLAFYAVTSVAIWVEGDRRLLNLQLNKETGDSEWIVLLVSPNLSIWKQLLVLLGIGLFFLGSVTQGNVHGYFRDLKELTKGKYTFPQYPLFDYTLTPHYAAECLEYVGLALILAPQGQLFSTTMLCALAFVVVNLGVTADGTREWYKEKFGVDTVKSKSRMIPFVW